MQFPSEFEWISPSGRGLLTHYMPAHYSAGWWMDSSATLEEAETADLRTVLGAEEGRADPQRAAAGRHRLHAAEQVGHRDPPRLERALHLAAVRVRAAAGVLRRRCGPNWTSGGPAPSPQTRDMNPIYTGKDVSYIDTKQANREAENAVLDGERFAVFAGAARRRRLPAGRAGQGVGAAGLRRPPRRDHRLGVRPGLPRPADRLARRVGAGPRRRATTRSTLISSAVDGSGGGRGTR